jgi:hypothetical protein
VRSAIAQINEMINSAAIAVSSRFSRASSAVRCLVNKAGQSRHFRNAVKIALGVGALTAVAWYVTARGVGTVFSAVNASLTKRASRVADWVRSAALHLQST